MMQTEMVHKTSLVAARCGRGNAVGTVVLSLWGSIELG